MNTGRIRRKQFGLPVGVVIGAGIVALGLVFGLPNLSLAQDPGYYPPAGPAVPYWGGNPYWGGYSYRSSTPGESYARGLADWVRARGEYNRLSSEAAINLEEARARAIVNAKDAVDAYFQIRQKNRDYRQAERGPRPTPEQLERYAQAARPTPLSPSELDTVTGRVRWPILLRDDRFASLRAEMEELLDRWAVSRNLGELKSFGTEQHLAVRRAIGQMEDELRANVRTLPPHDYASSQQFLTSLEYQVLDAPPEAVSLANAN